MREAGIFVLVLSLVACGPDGRDDGAGGDAMGDDQGSDMGGGGGGGSGGGGGGGEVVYVYAHTASTLYRVDPDNLNVQMVGAFGWGSVGSDQMTDIAVDKAGTMIGISYSRVFKIDPSNAQTTLMSSSLDGTFNGLSFVPATMLGMTGDDVLVAVNNSDGRVMKIDPMTGNASQVGNMGAYQSSGDLVAVDGFGVAQTVSGGSSDRLAKLAPMTFAATPIGNGTGFGQIWGVAYWKGKVYGFTNSGHFVLIDPTTGTAMMVTQTPGINWWGAAVTTLAPILQ